ncbi:MAG: hypothetical protein L6R42_004786 [Xanthoria sp. 1 TBL-2021]|nr:MAG: hypothetical protein L6R42_004786 [Xanthoria sp. 1 TBL-2021]
MLSSSTHSSCSSERFADRAGNLAVSMAISLAAAGMFATIVIIKYRSSDPEVLRQAYTVLVAAVAGFILISLLLGAAIWGLGAVYRRHPEWIPYLYNVDGKDGFWHYNNTKIEEEAALEKTQKPEKPEVSSV